MSNYEQIIKELLEKKKLQDVLLIAFSNSLKLKLTTTAKTKDKLITMETKINLINGITTKINDKSLLSQDNNILKFHSKQIENAYEIWDRNRETLVTILQIISGNSIDLSSFNNSSYLPQENNDLDANFTDFQLDSAKENIFQDENESEYEETIEDNNSENWIDDLENNIEESFFEEDLNSDNFDDISSETEEKAEVFIDEEKKEAITEETEEDWDNLINEMPEEEAIISKGVIIESDNENNSPSLEVENDWQEWLDEDDLSNHNGDYNAEAIDWSQEDWQEEEIK